MYIIIIIIIIIINLSFISMAVQQFSFPSLMYFILLI